MVVRKRLIFWLIKAYIKKSGKTIVLSFFAGLIIFFTFLYTSSYIARIIPIYKKAVIGIAGAYTEENLPSAVVDKLSEGLTSLDESGKISPAIASSWDILDNGKTYVFHIRPEIYFSDGKQVTSDLINYNFSDVSIERPNKSTIIFKLKDSYAPFLVTVSRPVFQKGLIGISEYKIQEVKLNGNFIQSLTLVSTKNRFDIESFQFYPTTEALKLAFLMGEINQAWNLDNPYFRNKSFADFRNTTVDKSVNRNQLVTLFYSNTDGTLSDKRVRLALNYALPDDYPNGEQTFVPYPENSQFFNHDLTERKQDYAHAKLLLSAATTASNSANTQAQINLHIKTLSKYKEIASAVAKSWTNIGINATVEEVDSVPTDFQIYLGDFNLSKDPDQYPLWHSKQPENITKYVNLRIDKLLEDGRKTVDLQTRIQIYKDFQKYLLEDAPASFLYFPYQYSITRK